MSQSELKQRAKSIYLDIFRNLWFAGDDDVMLNGRNFHLTYEDAIGKVEVCEGLEFLMEIEHASDLEEWVEYLYFEDLKQTSQFLLSMSYPGENGREWTCSVSSLAEIARTIGCSDFNETNDHRVFAVIEGIPVELDWRHDHRNLCIDFGEFGSYEYPDH